MAVRADADTWEVWVSVEADFATAVEWRVLQNRGMLGVQRMDGW